MYEANSVLLSKQLKKHYRDTERNLVSRMSKFSESISPVFKSCSHGQSDAVYFVL